MSKERGGYPFRTKSKIDLEVGRTFTLSKLSERLNEKFGAKVSGRPFTVGDVTGYKKRGYLPDAYGGYKLISYDLTDEVGVSLIKVVEKD